MNNCCVCVTEPQAQEKPVDESFVEALARGKRERQEVLRQVRQRRAIIFKRMAAKYDR